MREYDEIGRDAFLAKYGFGEARSYFVVHDGKRYDSKAIVGAAHGYQFPDRGPLRPSEFSAGDATVRPTLEKLGFQVERPSGTAGDSLLDALAGLRVSVLPDGTPAPYKPLLVLVAIARVQADGAPLTGFREFGQRLDRLPVDITGGRVPLPDPYWRLQNDGDFWEVRDGEGLIRDRYPAADPPPLDVLEGSQAGLTPGAAALLGDSTVLVEAAGLVARTYFPGAEDAVLAAVGIVGVPSTPRRVWWVNQGATFAAERAGGFLWAPLTNRAGRPVSHHVNVSRVRVGDVVVHYANGAVRALGEVEHPPVEAPRPESLPPEEWSYAGYLAKVRYFDVEPPISKSELGDCPVTAGPFDRNGNVKQVYLVEVDPSYADHLETGFLSRWPAGSPFHRRCWLFQANPGRWNLAQRLRTGQWREGELEDWTVSRHQRQMSPGDKVALWLAGPDAGVYALGELATSPEARAQPSEQGGAEEIRADVRLLRILDAPIAKARLLADPVLKELSVLKAPQGTNFPVTADQWSALLSLVEDVSPDGPSPGDLTVAAVQAELERSGLLIESSVVATVIAALRAGKHIILTGPPGTGKTTLAEAVARAATACGQSKGYTLTTATADWTTYETIGGLHPVGSNQLEFRPGQLVEAIQQQRWLVIDELNRSNFDRAFGQLFTVLSGQTVTLPYTHPGSAKPIVLQIETDDTRAHGPEVVVIPRSWRLIATMNVFDKSLLFEMSYALMRRFAFIEIPAPRDAVYQTLVVDRLNDLDPALRQQAEGVVLGLLSLRHIKELSPALFIDMAQFARQRLSIGPMPNGDLTFQLLYSYLLPQFEGITDDQGRELWRQARRLVGAANRDLLHSALSTVLGIAIPARPAPEDEIDTEDDIEAGTDLT